MLLLRNGLGFFSVHTVVLDDTFQSNTPDTLLFLVTHWYCDIFLVFVLWLSRTSLKWTLNFINLAASTHTLKQLKINPWCMYHLKVTSFIKKVFIAIWNNISAFNHAKEKNNFLKYTIPKRIVEPSWHLSSVLSLGNRSASYQCKILPSLWTHSPNSLKGRNKMCCLPQVLNFKQFYWFKVRWICHMCKQCLPTQHLYYPTSDTPLPASGYALKAII